MTLPTEISERLILWALVLSFVSGFYTYWLLGALADAMPKPETETGRYAILYRFLQAAAANFGNYPDGRGRPRLKE